MLDFLGSAAGWAVVTIILVVAALVAMHQLNQIKREARKEDGE